MSSETQSITISNLRIHFVGERTPNPKHHAYVTYTLDVPITSISGGSLQFVGVAPSSCRTKKARTQWIRSEAMKFVIGQISSWNLVLRKVQLESGCSPPQDCCKEAP